MNKTKYRRPVPNQKLEIVAPVNGPIISYFMDRDEMNAKYGPYKTPSGKRYRG